MRTREHIGYVNVSITVGNFCFGQLRSAKRVLVNKFVVDVKGQIVFKTVWQFLFILREIMRNVR